MLMHIRLSRVCACVHRFAKGKERRKYSERVVEVEAVVFHARIDERPVEAVAAKSPAQALRRRPILDLLFWSVHSESAKRALTGGAGSGGCVYGGGAGRGGGGEGPVISNIDVRLDLAHVCDKAIQQRKLVLLIEDGERPLVPARSTD